MCTQNNMDNTNNIPQNIEYMCVWTPQDIFLKLNGNKNITKAADFIKSAAFVYYGVILEYLQI